MLKKLIERPAIDENSKLTKSYKQLSNLISLVGEKPLNGEVTKSINQHIEELNDIQDTDVQLKNQIRKRYHKIISLVVKELKITPKNYYRNLWLSVGMSAFGIPIGVAFGSSLGNMAFIGIGIPVGMAIGIAIGTSMDKKAFDAGRQLDLDSLA